VTVPFANRLDVTLDPRDIGPRIGNLVGMTVRPDVMSSRPEAISLDAGGVLVTPDHGIIANALDRRGIPYTRARFTEGHYRAMAEVDRAQSEPETFVDYQRGFLRAIDVPDQYLEPAAAVLSDILVAPLWCQRLPGAVDAARRLLAAGFRLGITSNADGTIEDTLRRHEIAQVGPGPGAPMEVITDSGVLGQHKPDPAIFLTTAAGMGLPPEAFIHIGDSAMFDADGARNVGMGAVHVDPLELCAGDHHHVASLADFADELIAATAAGSPA
jgi:FMN phosphatase YigB (HAD superfamily)